MHIEIDLEDLEKSVRADNEDGIQEAIAQAVEDTLNDDLPDLRNAVDDEFKDLIADRLNELIEERKRELWEELDAEIRGQFEPDIQEAIAERIRERKPLCGEPSRVSELKATLGSLLRHSTTIGATNPPGPSPGVVRARVAGNQERARPEDGRPFRAKPERPGVGPQARPGVL